MPLPRSIIEKYNLKRGLRVSADMFLYRETEGGKIYFNGSEGYLVVTIIALNKQYSIQIPWDVAEDMEAVEKAIEDLKKSVN